MNGEIRVKVGGDYACFSRPEFKVERVSYPVMTPSAARGVMESIFWKPEFRWQIREIWVLNPIRQTTILRNEVSTRQGDEPFFVEHKRQQRASLLLKDVAYLICADMVLRPHARSPLPKYIEQFERRLARGQCHHTPYLGTREFAAWFAAPTADDRPALVELDVGNMLFDLAFCEDRAQHQLQFFKHSSQGRRTASGYAEALFFHAEVKGGVLKVPGDVYQTLYRLEDGNA